MKHRSIESRREQLYQLLPLVYKVLDSERVPEDARGPLREFLSIIGEQVNLLEDDLARWYDNLFIETCEDWVVPYLGDLVGYESASKQLDTKYAPESPLNRAVVFPRREVADTLALRRRKGTLAVLEELSRRIVNWPSRAIEYRRTTLGVATTSHLRAGRSTVATLHDSDALATLGTSFDTSPRVADVRRINSHRTKGGPNLSAVGLFVCRRKIDSATLVPARVAGGDSNELRTFDSQGLKIPLHILPVPEESPDTIAGAANLPLPLTRRMLRGKLAPHASRSTSGSRIVGADPDYYGIGKSLFIVVQYGDEGSRKVVPAEKILVTRLDEWKTEPFEDCELVAVDPETGRMAFHPEYTPSAVWTTYHYGRTSYMAGGEYDRHVSDVVPEFTVRRDCDATVPTEVATVNEALKNRRRSKAHSLIEIADNEEHPVELSAKVETGTTLEIRAANRFRPILRVPDRLGQVVEKCRFEGEKGSHLILDGLVFAEGEIQIVGEFQSIVIRHCSFAPGKAQLVLRLNETSVRIEKSLMGAITTQSPERADSHPNACMASYSEPIQLSICDSILDGRRASSETRRRAAHVDRECSLSGSEHWAHAVLTMERTTVFGEVDVHGVELVENSIFVNRVCVENCQVGCVRFSYIPLDSCTPSQFHCQPALATSQSEIATDSDGGIGDAVRVAPKFTSTKYYSPDQARLSDHCAAEILCGADDEGEMGVFHDEFFSQRAIHLRQRLEEFVPAGNDIEIIFEN